MTLHNPDKLSKEEGIWVVYNLEANRKIQELLMKEKFAFTFYPSFKVFNSQEKITSASRSYDLKNSGSDSPISKVNSPDKKSNHIEKALPDKAFPKYPYKNRYSESTEEKCVNCGHEKSAHQLTGFIEDKPTGSCYRNWGTSGCKCKKFISSTKKTKFYDAENNKWVNSTKDDFGNLKYGCGHESCAIVLDSNELSLSAYLDWKDTVGFEGDKSQCWSCYCRSSTKNEVNSQNEIEPKGNIKPSSDIHSQLKDEMQKDYAKGKKEVTRK